MVVISSPHYLSSLPVPSLPSYLPPIARAKFAKAGIDVDQLAAQVQDEGAKSFVESWNDLMEVIVFKSAALREAS
jgi:hypothetical protein